MKINYPTFLVLSLVFLCGLLFSASPVYAELSDYGTCASDLFAGGDGTSGSPWQISTAEQLASITFCTGESHDDKNFILINDIDVEGEGFENLFTEIDSNGWMPIGSYIEDGDEPSYEYENFYGNFDGNYHVISNVSSSRDSDGHGLFGVLFPGSSVANLGLDGFDFVGTGVVGGLAGYSLGDISGVYVANSSFASEDFIYVGGIVGGTDGGSISDSFTYNVELNGSDFVGVGGIAGYASVASLNRVFSDGEFYTEDARAAGAVGGIVGQNEGAETNDSFSVADMSTDIGSQIGGIAGKWGDIAGENNFWYTYEGNPVSCSGDSSPDTSVCDSVDDISVFKNIENEPLASWDIEITNDEDFADYNDGLPFLAWIRDGEDADSVWLLYAAGEEDPEEEPVVEKRKSERNKSGTTSVRRRIQNLISIGNIQRANELKAEWSQLFGYETQATSEPVVVNNTVNTTTVSPVATGVRDLTLEFEGDDVRRLQEILIAQNTGPMAGALAGIGATGYFGSYTRDALAEYQLPNGIVPAIGYFGIITRTQMTSVGIEGLWW